MREMGELSGMALMELRWKKSFGKTLVLASAFIVEKVVLVLHTIEYPQGGGKHWS